MWAQLKNHASTDLQDLWVYVVGLGVSALALIAPAKPLLIAALVMVGLDSLTGIQAALKRGERITSAGLRRTVSKAFVYTMAILAGFIGEKWLLDDTFPVSKLVAGGIFVVEFKSILENVERVAGVPIFSTLITRLGSNNDNKPKS